MLPLTTLTAPELLHRTCNNYYSFIHLLIHLCIHLFIQNFEKIVNSIGVSLSFHKEIGYLLPILRVNPTYRKSSIKPPSIKHPH